MITLKTLPQATAQEVFEQVARHLLTQKQPARINYWVKCQYRLENGLKCAAGCLIADDEYDASRMEDEKDTSWNALVKHKVVPDAHKDLIIGLQHIHDNIAPNYWKLDLKIFAKNHKLDSNFIDEFEDET